MRRLRRGPAAAEALAATVARELGRPLSSPLSRRGLARQTGRTRAQRLKLDPRSFRCGADLDRRRPLLVDDVTMTGATLRRAAEVLRAAGASAVCCAALAVTPDPRRLT